MTTAEPLKAHLEAACHNLWWQSESDYPVEVIWYELTPSQQAVQIEQGLIFNDTLIRQLANCERDDRITSPDFEPFFAKYLKPKSWHTDEDRDQLDRLRQLKALLASELPQVQVYRCGEVEVTLCVVGYLSCGVCAGIKTCLVET